MSDEHTRRVDAVMSPAEVDEAMLEIAQSWYRPMGKGEERVWRRTLPGLDKDTFKAVVTDFVSRGIGRPAPAEFFELARLKRGLTPAGQRARRHGPYLNEIPAEDLTPPEVVPERVAELREHLAPMSAPEQAEPMDEAS